MTKDIVKIGTSFTGEMNGESCQMAHVTFSDGDMREIPVSSIQIKDGVYAEVKTLKLTGIDWANRINTPVYDD